MARLSVIVTSYNIEDYLEACLDSILDQTLDDLEIIVVDDGSTDGSPDIVRRYAERDQRIVPVLLEDNTVGGVATAANAGLDRATSEWVGFADGDDLYEPEMFEALLSAGEDGNTDLAMCDYRLLDESTGESARPADANRWDDIHGTVHVLDVPTRKTFLRFIAVPWRKIYRRALLEDNDLRFPVGDYFYEDNPFHWFTLVSATSIAVVPRVLCHHRVARAGQTMSTADARLFRIFDHHETILAWLVERGVDTPYRPTLLGWAISQMEWISRRTPVELRGELFEALRQVFRHYDRDDLDAALAETGKTGAARTLSLAVLTDNLAGFHRTLDHRDGDSTAVQAAMYHLRHSDLRKTVRVAARYVGKGIARRLPKPGGRRGSTTSGRGRDPHEPTELDVLFALSIMDKRLQEIERRLDDLVDDGRG